MFRAPCRAGLLDTLPGRAACGSTGRSPINFARNSPASCSNIEIASLELQRFWAVSKNDRRKLCATFAGVVIAVTLGCCGQAPPPPTGTAACHRSLPRRHSNFACNSPLTISNVEFISLELQRFWTLLKVHAIELHAIFTERWRRRPRPPARLVLHCVHRCSRF